MCTVIPLQAGEVFLSSAFLMLPCVSVNSHINNLVLFILMFHVRLKNKAVTSQFVGWAGYVANEVCYL